MNGTNDRIQIEFLLRNTPHNAVLVDIGASYGYYAPFVLSIFLTVSAMVIFVFFVRVPKETLPPATQTNG